MPANSTSWWPIFSDISWWRKKDFFKKLSIRLLDSSTIDNKWREISYVFRNRIFELYRKNDVGELPALWIMNRLLRFSIQYEKTVVIFLTLIVPWKNWLNHWYCFIYINFLEHKQHKNTTTKYWDDYNNKL